jgi:transposase
MPYERLKDYFASEVGIPVSVGSLFNFNTEAYEGLEKFDELAKKRLQNAKLLHLDETGINVNGKRIWLHNASNDLWTYLSPHTKRGKEAMDDMGILPQFDGVMLHDNWKPYFTYNNPHALCNAHHLRELENLVENDGCQWAKDMQQLLLTLNEAVKASAKNQLRGKQAEKYRIQYEEVLKKADRESPPPDTKGDKKKRGRPKKSKARNLYERLRDRADDVLRFMYVDYVPFTNNQGENDIRMTKVQQKISGCFKSMQGANLFCRIRSYLITARKHGITPTDALKSIFDGRIPDVLLCDSSPAE